MDLQFEKDKLKMKSQGLEIKDYALYKNKEKEDLLLSFVILILFILLILIIGYLQGMNNMYHLFTGVYLFG